MSGCTSDTKLDEEDWISVKRLAAIRGVSHQAVSKRVAFFMRNGLLQARRSGKEKLVHRPTFESLVAAAHDPAQDLRLRHMKSEQATETVESIEPTVATDSEQDSPPARSERPISTSAYDDASSREKNAKAAMAEMELARRSGELVPARELGAAAVEIGTAIAQHLAGLKRLGGRLYAAAHTGGEDAVQVILTEEVNRVVNSVRDDLLKLATEDHCEPARPN